MSDWKTITLKDITSKIGDGLHGTPEYDPKGEYCFINGNNLLNGKIEIKETTQSTNHEEFLKYKKTLNERTILISINGTLGNVALYNNEKCILGKSACYINILDDVDKIFIKYVLINKHFQEYINTFAHGTTIQNVSLNTIREYPFKLPSFEKQINIAKVLSSLDDKIELLHRQNKTLEALAQTLFRQWFFEEADESWKIDRLGNFILIHDSKRIPVSNIERAKMKTGKLYPYYGAAKIMDYVNQYIFDGEYILMGEDGTVQTEEGFPILQMPVGKFWVNNHAHVFEANPPFSNYFIYIFLKLTNISSIVTGAVQPKINQEALKNIDFTVPPEKLTKELVENFTKIWDKIKSNINQIHTLTQLRDTLLPKLMSGEVRVEG